MQLRTILVIAATAVIALTSGADAGHATPQQTIPIGRELNEHQPQQPMQTRPAPDNIDEHWALASSTDRGHATPQQTIPIGRTLGEHQPQQPMRTRLPPDGFDGHQPQQPMQTIPARALRRAHA